MKLITRLRGAVTFCSGLFWSLAARADLPKIAGGANSADVMEDVKIMSRNTGAQRGRETPVSAFSTAAGSRCTLTR